MRPNFLEREREFVGIRNGSKRVEKSEQILWRVLLANSPIRIKSWRPNGYAADRSVIVVPLTPVINSHSVRTFYEYHGSLARSSEHTFTSRLCAQLPNCFAISNTPTRDPYGRRWSIAGSKNKSDQIATTNRLVWKTVQGGSLADVSGKLLD